MNLYNYTETEPLTATESTPILAPAVPPWKGNEILGFAAETNRDMNCMVAQETRWPNSDGSQNYYRKLGGYSYDMRALKHLQRKGVERIVIQEMDNDRVLEFDIEQFLNGEDGGVVEGYPQYGVPTENAIHTWSLEEATINSASNGASP